ncbi:MULTISPECIES: flagellar biosynthetic protein FliO [Desulfovibrio]|uniref:flagellar biosynthetic protein FliO n=1 Tax=Desulfovibrio TaxID=872 RepID=UPI00041B0ECF|nr:MULTISPECIES: flagellar biosynthetic protein FliO [Desulfovibrio]MDY0307228.1 flagellar biosynthetic protein FliO [Desulfovibrionaceae bacterium]HMM39622.1 flagellar biosynthetic protein FliO [Desulfovibrio sp.]
MADAANATAALPPIPDASLLGSVLSMAAALSLVLALIFLGFYLVRRFGPASLTRARGGAAPALLGRLFLGNRQSVAVVRVLGKTLVLGVTEQQISLLAEAETTDAPAQGAGFSRILDEQGRKSSPDDPA